MLMVCILIASCTHFVNDVFLNDNQECDVWANAIFSLFVTFILGIIFFVISQFTVIPTLDWIFFAVFIGSGVGLFLILNIINYARFYIFRKNDAQSALRIKDWALAYADAEALDRVEEFSSGNVLVREKDVVELDATLKAWEGDKVNITDEQKRKIDNLFVEFDNKLEAIIRGELDITRKTEIRERFW